MIQFNLLPDVKIAYIKAKKAKRTVIVIGGLSLIVSVGLLKIMLSVTAFQKNHISNLSKDINKYEKELQDTEDLSKILTIQNQLNSLPDLYDTRPATGRLFNYIQATTPKEATLIQVDLDYEASTLVLKGTATTLEFVNKYVDTFKFTTYSVKDEEGQVNGFSDVVLTTFARDSKVADFTITMTFDPIIFDATKEVSLNVPKIITTRSETESPDSGVFGGSR